MTTTSDGMKYITIIETGYWVRFHKGIHAPKEGRQQALREHRIFPVRDFSGSWPRALKAAKSYRNDYLASGNHDRSYSPRGLAFKKARKDSTSGIPGVSFVCRPLKSGNKSYSCQATWRQTLADGNRVKRSKCYTYDSDNESSKQDAFKLAKSKRAEMLKIHYRGDK